MPDRIFHYFRASKTRMVELYLVQKRLWSPKVIIFSVRRFVSELREDKFSNNSSHSRIRRKRTCREENGETESKEEESEMRNRWAWLMWRRQNRRREHVLKAGRPPVSSQRKEKHLGKLTLTLRTVSSLSISQSRYFYHDYKELPLIFI